MLKMEKYWEKPAIAEKSWEKSWEKAGRVENR